jgi:hypothetical protein
MSKYREEHEQALAEWQWATGPPAAAAGLPDFSTENGAFSLMLGYCVTALVVVALVYLYLASPAAVNLDLGGLDRLVTVKQFYDHPPADMHARRPVLAIGDSMTASGIDCAVLDELAGPAGYVSYNLSTSSKTHSEFLLDIQQPLLREAIVVTLVNPATFSLSELGLADRKANLIRVLDYPLEHSAWQAYAAAVPSNESPYLFRPRWQHVLDSRWRLVTNLETKLRVWMPWVSPKTKELVRYHREVYSRDLKWAGMPAAPDAERTWRMLQQHIREDPRWQSGDAAPAPRVVASYNFIHERLERAAHEVIIVIAPVHPAMQAAAGTARVDSCKAYLASLASSKTRVIDCSRLLTSAEFRDEVHPNRAGAAKVTRMVAAAMGCSASSVEQR